MPSPEIPRGARIQADFDCPDCGAHYTREVEPVPQVVSVDCPCGIKVERHLRRKRLKGGDLVRGGAAELVPDLVFAGLDHTTSPFFKPQFNPRHLSIWYAVQPRQSRDFWPLILCPYSADALLGPLAHDDVRVLMQLLEDGSRLWITVENGRPGLRRDVHVTFEPGAKTA